ncbi:MAG: outer membrane beta-barrel protein [Aquabacterium sp.]|nr:outer membrane beta-barrel protein [Ferruginibacter sp.]
MNLKLFFILFLLIFSTSLSAQHERVVSGQITDTSNIAIPNATIKFCVKGAKDSIGTISEANGSFRFSGVLSSKFTLSITCMGYETYVRSYHLADSTMNIRIEEISLLPLVKILEEVVITHSPSVLIKTDTIEFKADSFAVKRDAFVEDLLKKLPGVQVDRNGVVRAQGKQVTKIKVNGKDFFGGDIKAATQELPSYLIDKVQVIDDYGDAAAVSGIKTGEPNKVINLQLKKENSTGIFGRAEAGYGTSNSYKAALSTNSFTEKSQFSIIGRSNNINGGLPITGNKTNSLGGMASTGSSVSAGVQINGSNSSTNNLAGSPQLNSSVPQGITTSHSVGTNFRSDFGKKNSFYGSYNFGRHSTYGSSEIVHQIFYPTTTYTNHQHFNYTNEATSHQSYLNLELYPTALSYIKISPSFYYGNTRNSKVTYFDYFKDTITKTTEGYIRDSSTTSIPDFGVDVLFNQGFSKGGRNLSVSLNMNTSNTHSLNVKPGFTRTFETPGGYDDRYQNQLINQDNKSYNYSFYLTYTEPLAKNKFIDLTYFHDFSNSSNYRKAFQHNPTGIDSLLSDLSNQFTSSSVNDKVAVDFRTSKKKYNYSLGLSILPMSIKNYLNEKGTAYDPIHTLNFAPRARLGATLSGTKSIGIVYNGNSRRPSYIQFQPIRDVSNPQYQNEGNPDLKSEFIHNVNLSYNTFNLHTSSTFFTGLNLRIVKQKIITNTIMLDTNGAQLSRPENINGSYSLSSFYTFTKPYDLNKYVFSLNGSINYNHDPILVNSAKTNNTNWFVSQELLFTYNNKWIESSVGVNYGLTAPQSLISKQNNLNFSTWLLSHDMRMDVPGKLALKYYVEYIINNALTASREKNIILVNLSLEKKLSKKRPFYLSIAGYNIFNQNSFFSRQFFANSVVDVRSLQLNRYFLIVLNYRWNKFHG